MGSRCDSILPDRSGRRKQEPADCSGGMGGESTLYYSATYNRFVFALYGLGHIFILCGTHWVKTQGASHYPRSISSFPSLLPPFLSDVCPRYPDTGGNTVSCFIICFAAALLQETWDYPFRKHFHCHAQLQFKADICDNKASLKRPRISDANNDRLKNFSQIFFDFRMSKTCFYSKIFP